MKNVSRGDVIKGLFWRFAERLGSSVIAVAVSMVLARLLEPAAYGTIALVSTFTAILDVFVDSGMGNALIQKKNADDLDFSTVFFFNMVMCCLLYAVIFVSAPYIALFYNDLQLTAIIRVLSLSLIISGIKNVQQAYVSRTMQFKRFFFASLGGTIGAAVVGIIMAYAGFGVWALISQQLFNMTVDTVILWISVEWRPKRMFSIERLKGLFSYGWKLLASSLLDTFDRQSRSIIIGKKYSTVDLAFYDQGSKIPDLLVSNINSSIDSVLFPAMSYVQDDNEKIRNMVRRSIKTSVYIMAPIMIGVCAVASPMVRILLTEKWLPCVPFLRICCICYIFYPIHTANLNAIRAMGRSDLFLKLEIWKKLFGVAVLFISMWFGVMALAAGSLLVSVVSQIINSWPNKKLLNYSYISQMKDIIPEVLLAACMGICVYSFTYLGLPDLLMIIIQVVLGIVFYLGGSILFKLEAFQYLYNWLKSFFAERRNERRERDW